MMLTPVRALVYEEWLCKNTKFAPNDFAKIGEAPKLKAFRAVADEQYRYHQFWGSMSLVFPALVIGLVIRNFDNINGWQQAGALVGACFIEGVTIWAAIESFKRYVARAKSILS